MDGPDDLWIGCHACPYTVIALTRRLLFASQLQDSSARLHSQPKPQNVQLVQKRGNRCNEAGSFCIQEQAQSARQT